MKSFVAIYILLVSFTLVSCGPRFYSATGAQTYSYNVNTATQGEKKEMGAFLKPYSDSVNKSMNTVLGQLQEPLTKSWPECSLGYFMTDAYLEMAALKFDRKVDVAVMNFGGIRLPEMLPGAITRGRIFELMPFDNLMVLVEVTGAQLQAFFDQQAQRGGWPVSGATYVLENKKATGIMIGGQPLDTAKKYVLATSDYVANGGDESNALKGVTQINMGYLQRDALIAYVEKQKVIRKPSGSRVVRKEN